MELAFPQQLHINLGDLFDQLLGVGKGAQPVVDLRLPLGRDGDLAHAAFAKAKSKDPNWPVTLASVLAALAMPAAKLIAAHHPGMHGTGQDGGRIGHLLNQAIAESGEFDRFVSLSHLKKDNPA